MQRTHATQVDAGLDLRVLPHMTRTLDRLADEAIPLPRDSTSDARRFFSTWADEPM